MSAPSPIVLYGLVPMPGGPFFSSPTARVQLALLHKRIAFTIVELTYKELRTGPYRDYVGLGKDDLVTVPFIKRSDGSYLMDSLVITQWLDEAYPDRPSIYTPAAPLPIDVKSKEYQDAVGAYRKYQRETFSEDGFDAYISLYIVRLCAMLSKEGADNDFDYITSPARMGGEGKWDARVAENADSSSKANLVERANAGVVDRLDALLEGKEWMTGDGSSPGIIDFHAKGLVRMLASKSRANCDATFGRPAPGRTAAWVQRMLERYADGELPGVGLADFTARDAEYLAPPYAFQSIIREAT